MLSEHETGGLLKEALGQDWYHTLELAPGAVTNGAVDLRPTAPKVLPRDLTGLRALDVGTFDGFWAFELERRGAREVMAADLDRFDAVEWPPIHRDRLAREMTGHPGQRFDLAAQLLGSGVRRIVSSIYDLTTDRLDGPVDYAVVGDLLIHLRDPVRGLEAVRGVLSPAGRLLLVEQLNLPLTVLRPRRAAAALQSLRTDFNWWEPNLRCLRDWLALAGFGRARRVALFRLRAVRNQDRWHVALEARRS